MTTALAALDTVVERYGPATLTDPLALGAALRGLTDPLPEDRISLLTEAAASGAPARLRTALEAGTPVGSALDEAVALAAGAGRGTPADAARWAVTHLGCAAGLLPRRMADEQVAPAVQPHAAGAAWRRPRGRVVPGVAVGAVVAVAAVAALAWTQLDDSGDAAAGPAPSPSAGPSTTAPALPAATPSASGTPAATGTATPTFAANPREVFQSPELLRLAEPYLRSGGVQCREAETPLGVEDAVACSFDDSGMVGFFYRYLGPEGLANSRRGLLSGEVTAVAGTVRQLPWRFVDRQAGTKAGIPVGTSAPAEGMRVRFQSVATDRPTLYFDQESTLCSGLFTALTADRTRVRDFWADPER